MDDQSVILAVDGAVATVTLNRPDKLNSFTAEMHARLRDALDRVADDPAIGPLCTDESLLPPRAQFELTPLGRRLYGFDPWP